MKKRYIIPLIVIVLGLMTYLINTRYNPISYNDILKYRNVDTGEYVHYDTSFDQKTEIINDDFSCILNVEKIQRVKLIDSSTNTVIKGVNVEDYIKQLSNIRVLRKYLLEKPLNVSYATLELYSGKKVSVSISLFNSGLLKIDDFYYDISDGYGLMELVNSDINKNE